MDYRAFEQRLLDTIFTTDVQLNPATIAFLYKLSVQEASDLLQQAAVAGLLNIESDDEGNIIYLYPNRVKLPGRENAGPKKAGAPGIAGIGPGAGVNPMQTALARTDAAGLGGLSVQAAAPGLAPGRAGADLVVDSIDMTEAAGSTPAAGPDGHRTMSCPFCSETVLVGAKKCKHCHEFIDFAMRDLQALKQASATPAALVPAVVQQQFQQQQLQQLQQQQQQQLLQISSTSATQAALLSFFVPGLGQMCSGRVPAGLLWMMFTCLGYVCFIVPGIVLHILCVINAARQPRQLA